MNYRKFPLILALVFTIGSFGSVQATDDKNANTVELKFIGNYKNKPVFELSFLQPANGEDYLIHIRDEFGNTLYRETFNGSVISRRFMVNTDEIGYDVLRFEVTTKKTNKTIVFSINQSSRLVEEVSVVKLK